MNLFDKCYEEGWQGFAEGVENPYAGQSAQGIAWTQGFEAAEEDWLMRQEEGG